MTNRCAHTRALCAVLLAMGLVITGCANNPVSPTPPELITETFTGTLSPGGLRSHNFTVNYALAYSDASVTVTKLTAVSDDQEHEISVGIGFGSLSVGACTRAAGLTNPKAPYNTELPTNGSPFQAGVYCIAIFDNTDEPTVTEPLVYTLVVKHF